MISKGVNGKVSDIAQFTPASNRTSISRCLSSDYWNEKLLEIALKTCVVKLIWTSTKEAKQPIYFIINYFYNSYISSRNNLCLVNTDS